MDTSKDASPGKNTQPRVSAESATTHVPHRPQQAGARPSPVGAGASVTGRSRKQQELHLGVSRGAEYSWPHTTCMGTVTAALFGSTKLGSHQNVLSG